MQSDYRLSCKSSQYGGLAVGIEKEFNIGTWKVRRLELTLELTIYGDNSPPGNKMARKRHHERDLCYSCRDKPGYYCSSTPLLVKIFLSSKHL